MANTAHDRTRYMYDDIRACIREGMSIKETDNACDVSISTVRNYTKDIRDTKPRAKRLSTEVTGNIINDLAKGDTPKTIAQRYGIDVQRIYTIKYGKKKLNKLISDNVIDITSEKIEEQENDVKPIETKPMHEVVVSEKEIRGIDMFKNFSACFDGQYGRYSIRDNKRLRIMIGESYCEIPFNDIFGIAKELIEISKMFA